MRNLFLIFILFFIVLPSGYAEAVHKTRIFIVSSYHREYGWEQAVNEGICAGLVDFKFLDNRQQAEEFTRNDYVETETTVVKKNWMDTKHKSSKTEIAAAAEEASREINEFKPDLIFLGDDNAANYVGTQFVDTAIPVVFWGIDGLPLKYGLLDSIDRPGHNVTGIYQSGYSKECLEYLVKLVPGIKTFAVLSDGSETGRAKTKIIKKLDQEGSLPVRLTEAVVTNSFSEWQSAALRLQSQVDAFFIVNHNTLRDEQDHYVEPLNAMAWYLENIRKPECSTEKQWAQEGALLVVDDSGYKQGYEAVRLASQILKGGKNPADIPSYAPGRGAIIVNRDRAKMLGIDTANAGFIDEYIDGNKKTE